MKYPWTEAEKIIFKPKPNIKVSELAAKIRIVTRGPARGLWTNGFAPYLVEPMDTFNLPWVRKIYLCFAPQMGKTQVAMNCLLFVIMIAPGPCFYIMPDEKVMKRIMNRQIIPMVRATKEARAMLGPRKDDVTQLKINFKHGMDLMAAWASSAASVASESARYMFYDEPGKYPDLVGDEADPFSLGDGRVRQYMDISKQLYFSTPKLAGDAFDNLLTSEPDETRHYNAKCPYCDALERMRFRNFHWGNETDSRVVAGKKLARYRCQHCEKNWDDSARDFAVKLGRARWIAEAPIERPIAIAFGPLESWNSPRYSMSEAVAAYIRGKKDPAKMQGFINQHKALPWKEIVETKTQAELLKNKSDLPSGIVPKWAVAVTAGIDTQKRGFWFVVRAWDADLNSHLVQYGYITTFEDVESLVFLSAFQTEGGAAVPIWRAAIDTGGGTGESEETSRTEEVYQFLIRMRIKHGDRLHGIKGSSHTQLYRVSPPKQLDKMPSQKTAKVPNLLALRTIDTYAIKVLLHARISTIKDPVDDNGDPLPVDGQFFDLHEDTGIDYIRQILSEELRRDRKGKKYWHKLRAANHLLDCEVYAAACADDSWAPSLKIAALYAQRSKQNPAKQTPSTHKKSEFNRPSWLNR